MTILQFPTPTAPARTRSRTSSRPHRASERSLYPRRFHPLREHTPFLMPILVSVIGAVLALSAGYAVVEIQRAAVPDAPTPSTDLPAE